VPDHGLEFRAGCHPLVRVRAVLFCHHATLLSSCRATP
jgi:hypothetical protein